MAGSLSVKPELTGVSNSRDTDGSAPAGHGLRRVLRGLAALLLLGACAPIAPTLNAPLRSPAGNTEYRLLDLARGAGVAAKPKEHGGQASVVGHAVLGVLRDALGESVRDQRRDRADRDQHEPR